MLDHSREMQEMIRKSIGRVVNKGGCVRTLCLPFIGREGRELYPHIILHNMEQLWGILSRLGCAATDALCFS